MRAALILTGKQEKPYGETKQKNDRNKKENRKTRKKRWQEKLTEKQ